MAITQEEYDAIEPGDRVTFLNRFGQKRSGRAQLFGPGGWVLDTGGRGAMPAIVRPEHIVSVSRRKGRPSGAERGLAFGFGGAMGRPYRGKRRNKVSEVIKVKRSESSKFGNTLVERLHEMTLEGFAAEELGDVQDFGWYGLLLLGDDPITAEYDDESEKITAAILTEDSQGFVYADTFTTEKAAKKQWSKIEDEYEEFAKEAEAEEAEEEEESEW